MKYTLLLVFLLSSCSIPTHLAEEYYSNGMLARREIDINPSIGGVHSQKGADGYQADDDNQKSLADTANAGLGYGLAKQTSNVKISDNGVKNTTTIESTKQLKNASDAASRDLETTTKGTFQNNILTTTGKGPPGKNFLPKGN